ncbi:MAG: DUF3419 family protein [Rhizobiaceae bacterium]
MTQTATNQQIPAVASPLKEAVFQNSALSGQGILERLFTAMFNNLVYPQIWEDPVVDMEALAIRPGDHVVAIASGGCNVMSYLLGDPARVSAVDLNTAHLCLTKLKVQAAKSVPGYGEFRSMFADAKGAANVSIFDCHLKEMLDRETREYWSKRMINGRRRIDLFSRNFYRFGVLGRFIATGHIVSRMHGVNPAGLMKQPTLADQRRFFETQVSPLFDNRLLRWILSSPISLYGLGIPPAQYSELAEGRHMADVVRERLGRLACGHSLHKNYFARQAFGRNYGCQDGDAALPPYLEERNWHLIRSRAHRVRTAYGSITDFLNLQPARSVNKIVLLDAQDWMTNDQLNALWSAITRAAAPGGRVIFRTAARRSPLDGRVSGKTLSQWHYNAEMSDKCLRNDRSAIYGGFHLYEAVQ